MSIYVFVTISTVTSDGTFHHALPRTNDTSALSPVLFNGDIRDEILLVCDAMQSWHPPDPRPKKGNKKSAASQASRSASDGLSDSDTDRE